MIKFLDLQKINAQYATELKQAAAKFIRKIKSNGNHSLTKHPNQPQSPYSASKIGADMMALSFYTAFELPITSNERCGVSSFTESHSVLLRITRCKAKHNFLKTL